MIDQIQPKPLPTINLTIARLSWASLTVLAIIILVQAIPARYRELTRIASLTPYDRFHQKLTISFDSDIVPLQLQPEDAAELNSLGFSIQSYAGFVTACEAALVIGSSLVGAVIFWYRAGDRLGLFSAITFLLNGFFYVPITSSLIRLGSGWELPAKYIITFGAFCAIIFVQIFPDGRFIPRWTRPVIALWTIWALLMPLSKSLNPLNWSFWPLFLFILALFSALFASQFYRYVWVSTAVQRQQTKWFISGLAIAYIAFIAYNFDVLGLFFPLFRQPGLPHLVYTLVGLLISCLAMLLPPLAVFIGILRYKLWEIDLIIRRSLIYGSLTFSLGLVYLACVLITETLLQGFASRDLNGIATVISTLVIAAMFSPLRRRIQNLIDRRFYRHRYDAERTLQAFSATLRNEMDLDQLSLHLVKVVQDTVQPEGVSFWLRETGKGKS